MQLLRETQHGLLTELCITYKHFFYYVKNT